MSLGAERVKEGTPSMGWYSLFSPASNNCCSTFSPVSLCVLVDGRGGWYLADGGEDEGLSLLSAVCAHPQIDLEGRGVRHVRLVDAEDRVHWGRLHVRKH